MGNTSSWGGFVLILDGVAGLIWPSRYLRLWKVGPEFLRSTMEALAERPDLTRALCISEVALGTWMIAKEL